MFNRIGQAELRDLISRSMCPPAATGQAGHGARGQAFACKRGGHAGAHNSTHFLLPLKPQAPAPPPPHSYLYSGLTAVLQPDFQAGGPSGWYKLELRLGATLPRTDLSSQAPGLRRMSGQGAWPGAGEEPFQMERSGSFLISPGPRAFLPCLLALA